MLLAPILLGQDHADIGRFLFEVGSVANAMVKKSVLPLDARLFRQETFPITKNFLHRFRWSKGY
jgi:hypothetical protein